MATAAQIAANRANANKSTGPRTEAGKARSRANSLIHGLTGSGVVLPEEDRARWEHRTAVWAEELGARGELDLYLAGRAAMASVRLDRCVRNETATLQPRRAEALGRWQRARVSHAKVETLVKYLATDPAGAVRNLSKTVLGCESLMASWREMAAELEASGWWTLAEMRRVLNLLGASAFPTRASTPDLASFWLSALGAKVETDEEPTSGELARFFGTDDPAVVTLPGIDPSSEALKALCASELTRLAALRQAWWDAEDGPERQEALDKVMIDTTPDGMLRRRYETASTSELHRSLDQIHKNPRAADRASCEPDAIDLDSFRETKEVALAPTTVANPLNEASCTSGGTGDLFTSVPGPTRTLVDKPPVPPDETQVTPHADLEAPCEALPVANAEPGDSPSGDEVVTLQHEPKSGAIISTEVASPVKVSTVPAVMEMFADGASNPLAEAPARVSHADGTDGEVPTHGGEPLGDPRRPDEPIPTPPSPASYDPSRPRRIEDPEDSGRGHLPSIATAFWR